MPIDKFSAKIVQLPLNLFEVELDCGCTTREIVNRLLPFLSESHQKILTISALDRKRRQGETPLELKVRAGSWIVRSDGKKGRLYLWRIAFRPSNESGKVA